MGFSYAGRDFGSLVGCELVEPVAPAVAPVTAAVPGRAGALLLGCELPPLTLTVRLYLDAGAQLDERELASVHRTIRGWLAPGAADGADLTVDGEPGLTWRGAVLTGASDWSDLFEAAWCELEFTCMDPVAYGEERTSPEATFTVGGTWETRPVVGLTAEAGGAVEVADAAGRSVRVERAFAAGDAVVIDCGHETVSVNGAAADADVVLGSDFLALAPGACELSFTGCSAHTVTWTERWV